MEGNRFMSAGEVGRAEARFREALVLKPDFAEAHANLGLLLDQEGMPAEAEHHYLLAVKLNPDLGRTHMNLGVLLTNGKRFAEAENAYRRAIELLPDFPTAWMNLGVLQACLKREAEAERSYRKAIELDPGYRLAYFNLGYLLLRQGRFEEGWSCLEKRDWYARLEKNIPSPRWRGEPLEGRSLLIGFEAGHGDMIQLCRYAKVLKARGASHITMLCHPLLKILFQTLDGVDAVHAFDEEFTASRWDFWTPPFSIPFYCRTRLDSIPAEIPYLHADRELALKWAAEISRECPAADLRVGLVWKGSRQFENDADRSLPGLKTLESLGEVKGVRFFSLQKGAGEDEAASPPTGLSLVDLGPRLTDFADTAAIMTNLDLVISVDTAVAHLAGALGKACWLLLPDYKPDWRWLADRNDSPWYPGVMRLFRQPRMGDWAMVIDAAHVELQKLASVHGPVRASHCQG